jgi:hypothetical protein
MSDWHASGSYDPRQGIGIVVERNGQLGYAKLNHIECEKLGADLARLVGAPVPPVEIGTVEGRGPFAISHIHSPRSRPLAIAGALSEVYAPAVNAGLRAASGLLSFLGWIGADDHYGDTHLVVDELANGIRIVAIDFENAFSWAHGEEVVVQRAPPALLANVERLRVDDQLRAIENLSAAQIHHCCTDSGHQQATRIARVLQGRRDLLRPSFVKFGWLPANY